MRRSWLGGDCGCSHGSDINIKETAMNGASVVMFPGLCAAYPNMIEKYLDAFPEDQGVVKEWSDWVGCGLGGRRPAEPSGSERVRELEVHALNLLWWRRVKSRFSNSAVCGHSLGYYAAMVASGVLSEADSFRLIDKVFSVGWRHFGGNDDPVFVVTTKDDYDFAGLAREVSVEVLSENSQMQRVFFGSQAQYQDVRQKLNGYLLGASELGTHVPFHSNRMKAIRGEIQDEIAALAVKPGSLGMQLWSHISARPIHSSADAFNVILEQPHQTVRWLSLAEALLQAGRFEFVEVGPNRTLSQLVRWISPKLEVRFVDSLRR
jgi:[acyl-carrier-protein] S-malonyltransferase